MWFIRPVPPPRSPELPDEYKLDFPIHIKDPSFFIRAIIPVSYVLISVEKQSIYNFFRPGF